MTEVIEVTDKGEKSTVKLVKHLSDGYFIGQSGSLTDGGTFLENQSFYLVNSFNRVLIHDNDVETLEKFASDPGKLKSLEKTGMV